MKKTIMIILILGFYYPIFSQSRAIMEFHEKFKDNSKYFSLKIEGGILKGLSNVETDDADTKDLMNVISKIEAIDIHSINRAEAKFDDDDLKEFSRKIKKENFEDLLVVKNENSQTNFMIKESKGKVSDLLMMVDEADEFTVINISGNIDLNTISSLSKSINFKGSEHLADLEKD
jgi:hypothetical protein